MPAMWKADQSRGIARRVIVEADLVLTTPAHLGGGEKDGIEMILLTDALENKPLLTGASVAGALRHHLLRLEYGYGQEEDGKSWATRLFGDAYDREHGEQSRVITDDAVGAAKRDIRDGVRIDGRTRTAEDQKLFTHQVWEVGGRFPLRLELQLFEDDVENCTDWVGALCAAVNGFKTGEIALGARKSRGYGRVKVENWRILDLDMTTEQGVQAWLGLPKQLDTSMPDVVTDFETFLRKFPPPFEDGRAFFRVDATLRLQDSMLIRAGSDVSQMQHLNSNIERQNSDRKPVLSGTSLAGALRARATKICHTLGQSSSIIDKVFGPMGDDEKKKDDLQSSRLIVEETDIENSIFNQVQNRVKIDRFTGGAFETALFDQQPVFASDETTVDVKLELRRHPDTGEDAFNAQKGLVMLLLKDLWTADLALGGESSIGRGRLRGQEATLAEKHAESKEADAKSFKQPEQLPQKKRDEMQNWVKQFADGMGVA